MTPYLITANCKRNAFRASSDQRRGQTKDEARETCREPRCDLGKCGANYTAAAEVNKRELEAGLNRYF